MTDNQETTEETTRPSLDRATSFSVGRDRNSYTKLYFDQVGSKALPDPFGKHYREEGGLQIIRPPQNPYALIKIIQENSHLIQCMDSMVTNIHGFGYRMEFIGKKENETNPKALQELQFFEEFFDSPNPYMSFQDVRERIGWDYWALGNAYMEVGRDTQKRVMTLYHVPAPTMRVTKVDGEPTVIVETLTRMGKKVKVKLKKFYRRFVQIDDQGRRVYFKEFGDPRTIDPRTGQENTSLALEDSATEIIHMARYNGQSVYGIPLWHSQLPSVLGSRQAELTNLDFFENNGVPALAILVSGGYLTEEAFRELQDNFEQVKGRGSVNKVLILEARGAPEDASTTGQVPVPSITMKPLYSDRQNDALFQEYERQARDKIRSVFRLPPVFTGVASDYTYASAKVSMEIAENQIFVPERIRFDDMMNKKILNTWEPEFHRFRSNPAALATSEDVLTAIDHFTKAGAISPNNALGILNEKLNLDIPRIQEFWGDMPFELMKAILASHDTGTKAQLVADILDILNSKSIEDIPEPVGRVDPNIDAQAEADIKVAKEAPQPKITPKPGASNVN
jgi:PBSX family phage portal protein